MYLYNMQKMNIQILILGKGVTVKAYISFEKKLVLFVIAVFALCIYFELVTLSYLIHVYIENRFLGSLYKNFFIRMFGNIVQSIIALDFKRFFFVYFCPVFISMCVLEAEIFFQEKKLYATFI